MKCVGITNQKKSNYNIKPIKKQNILIIPTKPWKLDGNIYGNKNKNCNFNFVEYPDLYEMGWNKCDVYKMWWNDPCLWNAVELCVDI